MEKNTKMKLLLIFSILLSCASLFLHSEDLQKKRHFVLLSHSFSKENENEKFSHQFLDVLQERIRFLSQYRTKRNALSILLKNDSRSFSDSIVDNQDQISDFKARLELANVLSHYKESRDEALEQYTTLLRRKPDHKKIWLQVSLLYIAQGRFVEATNILYALVYHQPLNLTFLVPSSHKISPKKNLKETSHSLVNLKDFISDNRARLELARILARHKESLEEALQHYQILLNNKSYDAIVILELSRIYIQQKKYHTALSYLYDALEKHPCHVELLVEAAHAELGLAHGKKSHDLLLRALAISKQKESILMDEAAVYMLVGSFYKAEGIYREALNQDPCSLDLNLKLAWTWVSAQRYVEAEELYRSLLLSHPENPKILEALATLKIIEKDFIAAFEVLENLLLVGPKEPSYIQLKADALYQNQNYVQALEEFHHLSHYPKFYLQALIGLGRTYRKLERYEEAKEVFQKAYDYDPSSIQAQFYLADGAVFQNEFIQEVIQRTQQPQHLLDWANVYGDNGMGGIIEFYEAALNLDPDYFPAKTGLAEALSANYKYEDAITIYLSILEDFPEDSKMMIAVARVLSWGKRYENSIEWYDRVIAMNPQDPLPRWEKARVAYWGKFFDLSMQFYTTLIENVPLYHLRKVIALEREAKALDWKNYFLHALPVYQELITVNPGNQEALYGYAQDFCNLGLCKCSRQLYDHMLNIDPNSNLVKMALERNLLREHFLIQGNYSYWTERGSGQFSNSQIARHQLDEVFEWSPHCNEHIRFIQTEWVEYPFFDQKYYPAEGQTIEVDHVFNGYVRGFVSATRKNYFNEFPSRYTCLGTLWFNLYDYMQVGIGFEQKNEIYNLFTLQQGIQAKIYWTTLQASGHSWNLGTTYRHLDYNDSNTLEHVNLLMSYAFTEDPNVFKVIVNGNYRNAAHLTEIITNGKGEIVDVIHPYWTPKNYYAAGVTLQFRHNYAWFNYCEAPQRYIDVKLTGEDDTAHNPSIQLAINWKHEFMYHWGFEITGLYHRSKLWNADGIWTNVYYRF